MTEENQLHRYSEELSQRYGDETPPEATLQRIEELSRDNSVSSKKLSKTRIDAE